MLETCPSLPFERYADDMIVHCKSRAQAEWVRGKIEERLRRCKLRLHPTKTRVVACGRHGPKGLRSFDFLGFTFQPRIAKARNGGLFVSFAPSVSRKAAKALRERARRQWRLPSRTTMTLHEIASMVNPVLKGWIRYFCRFRPSALVSALRNLNLNLRTWVMRKFKRFRGRPHAAMAWLRRIALAEPHLFAHWEIAGLRPTVPAGR